MKSLVFKVYKTVGVHPYIKSVSCMWCPHDLLMAAPPAGPFSLISDKQGWYRQIYTTHVHDVAKRNAELL